MKQRNAGFTVIELLMVVALVGIMAVVVTSVSRNVIHRSSHVNGVNQLVADIASIKQSAAKESRYFALRFNDDCASYTIRRQTTIGKFADTDWTDTRTVQPLDGKKFLDAKINGFAINPMGMVYPLPFPVGAATPATQSIDFVIRDGAKLIYKKNIMLYSNGGIKIEK